MIRRPRRFALTFAALMLSACQGRVTTTPATPVAVERPARWFVNPAMADDDLLCVPLSVWDPSDGSAFHCALASDVRRFILTRLVAE